jgi:prophage antirepressor-like protein
MSELSPAVMPFSLDGHSLRVVMRDGEPWFVAADVCKALDIASASQAVNGRADRDGKDGLDDDERGTGTVTTPSGDQKMTIVNESGLYNLIFKSRKPEANRFKKWITSEVLPSIRKTGSYGTPKEVSVPANYIAALEDLLASKKAEALALCDRDYSMHP